MITGTQSMKVKELLNMIKEIMNNQIEIKYTVGQMAGHYKITPFSFRPKVALKISLESSYDLGQGLLETIYSVYEDLVEKGENTINFQKNE